MDIYLEITSQQFVYHSFEIINKYREKKFAFPSGKKRKFKTKQRFLKNRSDLERYSYSFISSPSSSLLLSLSLSLSFSKSILNPKSLNSVLTGSLTKSGNLDKSERRYE